MKETLMLPASDDERIAGIATRKPIGVVAAETVSLPNLTSRQEFVRIQ